MNRNSIFFAFIALMTAVFTQAQNPHTLVSIGDNKYNIEEFDFIYGKNNSYSEEPKSKKEYVDLFVNYKLKVHEAMAQGMDTMPSFLKEFNYYKDELAKPYLSDKSVTEKLKKEAYDRLTKEIHASHILIRVPKSATPEDTIKAHNKIKDLYDRVKAGENFGELAAQYSEDPSAAKNQGDLGYFSGFMMVYPFESAAYNTPAGEISNIIRTDFGYHIIQVHDIRENRGELRTAHIMQMFPQNSPDNVVTEKKAKIDSVYQLVLKGEDFGTLAQNFSEDRNSARNNGELPWFGSGRMIPEFSEPAFNLDSIGSISQVIRTPYGFHIIKLLEKRGVKSFDEMKDEISNRISRDERAFQEKKVVIDRLKKEYNYTPNNDIIEKMTEKLLSDVSLPLNDFYKAFDDTSLEIATLDNYKILLSDFIAKLKLNKEFERNKYNAFPKAIESFIDDEILAYEKGKLEDKYPDYKYLVQEYHDGLLIFEISQKEIWNKASEDSVGIVNYYNSHKAQYYFPEKLTGKALFAKDKKTLGMAKKMILDNPEISTDSLKQTLGKDAIKVLEREFEKGEFKAIDAQIWKDKKSNGKVDEEYPYIYAWGKTTEKQPKDFNETKGQVIADYQTEIEKGWLTSLKEKFEPQVNLKALKYSQKTSKKSK